MDRQIEKRTWTPKRIVTTLGIVLGAGFLVYITLAGTSGKAYTADRSRISIATVISGPFQDAVSIQGTVEPLKTIYITAPEGGNVEEIFVEDGAVVEKGTPLLRLSNSTLMLDYMNRETQIIEQINNLRNTRLNIEDNKRMLNDQLIDVQYNFGESVRQYKIDSSLFAKGVIAGDAYQQSLNNLNYLVKKEKLLEESMRREAQNRQQQLSRIDRSIELMERNLDAIQDNVENLIIRAPVSGQLTSFNPELGTSKTRGQNLGTINVPGGYKVRAQIDEYYLSRVKPGQSGSFNLSGNTFHVSVQRVIPEVTGGQFEAHLNFEDSISDNITRGQTLQIKLALSNTTEAVLVPRGGFFQSTGGNWIYVLDGTDMAVRREIRLGRQNTEYIEVLEGLEPGEQVLTNGYTAYGDATELRFKD